MTSNNTRSKQLLLPLTQNFETTLLQKILNKNSVLETGWTPLEYSGLLVFSTLTISWLAIALQISMSIPPIALLGIPAICSMPFIEKEFNKKELDAQAAELPLLIKAQLDTGESFEKAISCHKILERISTRMKKGEEARTAIKTETIHNPSKNFRRLCDELTRTYYTGITENLEAFAKTQAMKRKNQSKEYNNKVVMYSLFFVVTSAVLPTMFESFLIIGSTFMTINITPLQALLTTLIGFPLLSTIPIILMVIKRPA